MYNLWRFILKHHFVILFILLEVISILLLARSQNFHRNRVVNTTNDAVGQVYEWSSEVGNYFRLNKTNQDLAEENAWLRQQLAMTTDTTRSFFDIEGRDTIYEYIPAQVVNNSIGQANNYIIINKGRADGIERDMGVISSDGIVGVVADVSRHYASILSLLHSHSVVGVRFKNNQELGSLKWGNNNYRYVRHCGGYSCPCGASRRRHRAHQLLFLHFPRRPHGRHGGRKSSHLKRSTQYGQNPFRYRFRHFALCLRHPQPAQARA